MDPAFTDRRRREVLRFVAASCGLGTAGNVSPASRSPDDQTSRTASGGEDSRSTVTPTQKRPVEPTVVVAREDGVVRAFGLDGDGPLFAGHAGETLQRAVDVAAATGNGGVVAVSPGTYSLEHTVALSGSVWLAGAGPATTLRAEPGLDAPLLTVPAGTEHARVSDLRLNGNRAENDRGAGLLVEGYGWRLVVEHLVVRDVAGDGVRFESGPNGEYSYEPALTDVDVARCDGDGFVFGYTGDLLGFNLYAEGCGACGFTMADAGGTLVHPHAYDTRGEAGVRVLESAKDLLVVGAHCERNRRHGALVKGQRITVRDALVHNNSRDDPGAYSGLVLDSAANCTVAGSTFVNDASSDPTQAYGVVETNTRQPNFVVENLFRDNVAGAVDRDPSAESWYRANHGFRTENGGTATVGDCGTVQHGLNVRPRSYWVQATAPGVYAHVIDADETYLTVEAIEMASGQPPPAPVAVSWGASGH